MVDWNGKGNIAWVGEGMMTFFQTNSKNDCLKRKTMELDYWIVRSIIGLIFKLKSEEINFL